MIVGIGLVTMLGIQTTVAVDRGRRIAEDLARPPALEQVAYAVADGLHDAGLTSARGRGGQRRGGHAGERRCALEGVPAEESAAFAARSTRWSPRWRRRATCCRAGCCRGRSTTPTGCGVAFGRLRPDGEVWHSVPTVLGTTGTRAQAFAAAWDLWVGGGPAVYTGSPEGEGVLVTTRGSDPFAVTTVLRTSWR